MAALGAVDTFLGKVVTEIVNPVIYLLAALAFVYFVWGGVKFIAGAGDEQARTTGRRAILGGLVGLAIIFGAFGIINLALGTFGIDSEPPSTAPDTSGLQWV